MEAYLEEQFYGLAAAGAGLGLWGAYAAMRRLARRLYGLDLREDLLPEAAPEARAADVPAAARAMAAFARRHAYDLRLQLFRERRPPPGGRHLRAVGAAAVAASLRQHGLGVRSTAANAAYRCVGAAFALLSRALADDHVRSRLSAERRWHRANPGPYPHARAEALAAALRRLGGGAGGAGGGRPGGGGAGAEGATFLDRCRGLVAEMGNALAYARMVQAAAAHYCAAAMPFAAAAGEAPAFGPAPASASPETARAAEAVRAAREALLRGADSGADYLKMLVGVFRGALSDEKEPEPKHKHKPKPKHKHLAAFCFLVPALCISHADAALRAADALRRRARGGAVLADDGFAVGVAFVLAALGQRAAWEALRWAAAAAEGPPRRREEMEALLMSLSAARVFFG